MSGSQLGTYQPPKFDEDIPKKPKAEKKNNNEFNLLDIDYFDREEQPSQSYDGSQNSSQLDSHLDPDIVEEEPDSLLSGSKSHNKFQSGYDEDINSNSNLQGHSSAFDHENDLERNEVNIVQKPSGFWKYLTVEYYKQYFEVTTEEVVVRFRSACFPLYTGSIFDYGKIDLYGPIWTIITLNVAITIFGNMARYIKFETSHESKAYQSDITSLTRSVPLITFYFLIVPLFLSLLVKLGGSGKLSYFYVLSIYGYSFAIFIPATFLYILPLTSFKWFILLGAAAVSLLFITKELYNMARASLDDNKLKIAAGIMCAGHFIFILLMKWSFLH